MNKVVRVLSAVSVFALVGAVAFAQSAGGPGIGAGLIALGAGLAIGLAAIAVAIAQAVIPETLIIFGFVIAFFLNNQIGG